MWEVQGVEYMVCVEFPCSRKLCCFEESAASFNKHFLESWGGVFWGKFVNRLHATHSRALSTKLFVSTFRYTFD